MADGGELLVLAPGVGDFRRGPGNRPPDPQVRLLQHAAGHEVRPRNGRPAAEPLGRRPSDPRLLGRAVRDHLLPGPADAARRSKASAIDYGDLCACWRVTTRSRSATAGTRCPTESGSFTSAIRPWGSGRIAAGWLDNGRPGSFGGWHVPEHSEGRGCRANHALRCIRDVPPKADQLTLVLTPTPRCHRLFP